MDFYDELFKPAHLNELIDKCQEYDNSKLFIDFYNNLKTIEIPENAPADKKLILLAILNVLKDFYIEDKISYSKTYLNKIYFTKSLEQDRLRDLVSKDFLYAIDVSDGQLPYFPLWFVFAFPNIVKWFYEDFNGDKIICEMFSDSMLRIQMPVSEMTRTMINRGLYDTFDYFQPEYSFTNMELRKLVNIYNTGKSSINVQNTNQPDFGKFCLLNNISDANKHSYELILKKYYYDYKFQLGEQKYNEVSSKINESNSVSKLISESKRGRIKANKIDFTTYIPKMVLMFGKPETIALASLKVLERWNCEANNMALLGNADDLKIAILRILNFCERTKIK